MDPWHYWFVAGIILLALEIFTPGFVLASFSIGCFGSGIASFWGLGLTMQVAVFAIVTIVVFFSIRPLFNKFFSGKGNTITTGVQALVGKQGIVTESVDNEKMRGRVKIGGENWKARSLSGGIIEKDLSVTVQKVDGLTLYVDIN